MKGKERTNGEKEGEKNAFENDIIIVYRGQRKR